jgi:RimJ/RimL family protein N-acetyltransferase
METGMFPDLMRDDVFRLETERLWLRWPRAADASRIVELASDRDVAEMTARIPHPYPPGAAAEVVLTNRAGNLGGKQISLVLTPKQRPNEMLGMVELAQTAPDQASLGFWLGKPFWGKGLVSEAVCGLIDLSMRTVDLSAITASVRTNNAASRRVLEKACFVSEGHGVEQAPARGGSVAVERLKLTRERWQGCDAPTRISLELAQAN